MELAEGVAGQWARILNPAPDRILFPTRCLLDAHSAHHSGHGHILLLIDRVGLGTFHLESVIQSVVKWCQALMFHSISYLPILDDLCVLLSALRLHYDDPLLWSMHVQDHFLRAALAQSRIIFLRGET